MKRRKARKRRADVKAHRLHIRLSSDDRAVFETAAEHAGMALSEWMRALLHRAAKRQLTKSRNKSNADQPNAGEAVAQ